MAYFKPKGFVKVNGEWERTMEHSDKMGFLNRAEKYAEARGDENYFKHWYTRYREWYGVEDSVWCALTWLYDEDTAKLLKYQYWGPTL